MNDDEIPRGLPERTGRHRCVRCLSDVELNTWLGNDHHCDDCAEKAADFPFASTPHGEPPRQPGEKS